MSTPYVELQKLVIAWLLDLQKKGGTELSEVIVECRTASKKSSDEWAEWFHDKDMPMPLRIPGYRDFVSPELVLEQIDDSGEKIVIRNLLGRLLPEIVPYGLEGWIKERGNGSNLLRTTSCAQPRTLKPGDVLATGERVLHLPREGGNGAVLVKLSGGKEGTWMSFPSRTALALLSSDIVVPEGLIE